MESVYMDKSFCCGCRACAEKCPVNAIKMVADEEGFLYPEIDKDVCIDCGLCIKVCAFKPVTAVRENQKYFAVKNKDVVERIESQSGGAFYILAKKIIAEGGTVYGAAICDDLSIRHIRTDNIADCKRLRGSKYVQSDLAETFKSVEEDLSNERKVLFSGTSCQVAGLYGFLGGNSDNLYTVDIICHGVESPKVYRDYIEFMENKYRGKIKYFNFRDKCFGWNSHIETFYINDKKYARKNYTNLFYSSLSIRPCCGVCCFTNYNKPSDITIADLWGVKSSCPDLYDNKGVSSVMINTEKGYSLFSLISESADIIEISKEACHQHNLSEPTHIPKERNEFWELYNKKGFNAVLKKYGSYDILRRIKWRYFDLPKLKKNIKLKK